MALWADRMDLAARGWLTEIRIEACGTPVNPTQQALGIWARADYWHGWRTDICLHAHAVIQLEDEEAPRLLEITMGRVREACLRAAAEFPDEVPCQLADPLPDGRIKLVRSGWEMQHLQQRPRSYFPTEALFGADLVPDVGRHAQDLVEAARSHAGFLDIWDKISPHWQMRMPQDCQDREWRYEFRPHVRASNGVAVGARSLLFTAPILDELLAGKVVGESARALAMTFSRYAPGGDLEGRTPNGLPPGYLTRAEKLASFMPVEMDDIEELQP